MRGDELSLLLGNPFWASVLVVIIVAAILLAWDMYRDGVFSKHPKEPWLMGSTDDRPAIFDPERDPRWQQWQHWKAMQTPTEFQKREAFRKKAR